MLTVSLFVRQVELMASEEGGEPLRSVPLVISTYSVAETGPAGRAVRKVPRSALASGPAGQRLPLGDAALLALGDRRVNRVKRYLVDAHSLEPARMFECKSAIDTGTDARPHVAVLM